MYNCPICKKHYMHKAWFIKHLQKYSEKKLYMFGDEILRQGSLQKFLKNVLG